MTALLSCLTAPCAGEAALWQQQQQQRRRLAQRRHPRAQGLQGAVPHLRGARGLQGLGSRAPQAARLRWIGPCGSGQVDSPIAFTAHASHVITLVQARDPSGVCAARSPVNPCALCCPRPQAATPRDPDEEQEEDEGSQALAHDGERSSSAPWSSPRDDDSSSVRATTHEGLSTSGENLHAPLGGISPSWSAGGVGLAAPLAAPAQAAGLGPAHVPEEWAPPQLVAAAASAARHSTALVTGQVRWHGLTRA